MARVNIEDRFFGETRLVEFAHMLNCSQFEAIGLLVKLWHSSQERLIVKTSAEQIARLCLAFQPDRAAKVIEALICCSYIEQVSDDLYEIKGNAEQVASLKKFRARARKGGDATKKKWKKNSEKNDEKTQHRANTLDNTEESGGLKSRLSHASSLVKPRPNTIQDNTIQDNTSNNPPTPPRGTRGLRKEAIKLKDEVMHHYLNDGLEDPNSISDALRGFLEWKYRELRIAAQALRNASQNGSLTVFEGQLRDSIEVWLSENQ